MDHHPSAPRAAPLWHAGMRLTVLMDAAVTAGRFSLCEFHAPPGSATTVHRHDHEDEVVHVRAGRLEIWQRGEVHALGPGDALVLPRGLPHRLVAAGAGPAEFLLAIIPGGFEATLCAASAADAADVPDPDDVAALFAGAGVSILGWSTAGPAA